MSSGDHSATLLGQAIQAGRQTLPAKWRGHVCTHCTGTGRLVLQTSKRELLGELRECTRASGSPPQRQWSSLPAVITHHCHFSCFCCCRLSVCLDDHCCSRTAFAKLPNTRLLLLQSTSSAFLSQVELLGSVSHLTSETVYALVAEVDILLSSFDD